MTHAVRAALLIVVGMVAAAHAAAAQLDVKAVEEEALRHFLAILRLDTQNPPGNEVLVVDYLKGVLEQAGVDVKVLARDPRRPNLVARLRGNGTKKPLLIMGHTDVVTVDAAKWTHPPFSATRTAATSTGAARWTTSPASRPA